MTALRRAQAVTSIRGFAAMLFSIAASAVLKEAGVSFQVISLGNGVMYLILAAAEIPTGAWADIFGAKKASIIGAVLQTAAMVLFGLGTLSTPVIILAYALYGLGASLVNRAASSLMYETAREEGRDTFNNNRYFSMTEKSAVATYIVASFAVGFLSDWMGRKSLLVGGVFFVASALFIAFRYRELQKEHTTVCLKTEFFSRVALGYSVIRKSPKLLTLLPIRVLHQVEAVVGVMWFPWIQELGGSAKWFSVMATGSYLFRYAVNHQLAKRPKPDCYYPRITAALALMGVGSCICVMAAMKSNMWLAFFGVWIMAGARGAFLPASQAIQHEEFPDLVRTTGLSVMNFLVQLMVAVGFFISSTIIDRLSVQSGWLIAAGCFWLATCLAAYLQEMRKGERRATEDILSVVNFTMIDRAAKH